MSFRMRARAASPAVTQAAVSSAPKPSVAVLKSDPVVRRLVVATFFVIALWLAGFIGFLTTNQVLPDAPRTSAERALNVYQVEIDGKRMTAQDWSDYIALLISSGQYGTAQGTIREAMKAIKNEKSLVLLQQARLDFAREDYQAAVTSADAAIAQAKKDFELQKKEAARRGLPPEGDHLPQEETAVLLKGEAYQAAGAPRKALEAFSAYLEFQPTAANVYIERGDMRAAVGDKKGAEADYRKALTFTPDDARAREGLSKIGVDL